MVQTGKLVKVFVYLKGKRIEVEPDEARALLAQLKAALGEPAQAQQPIFIPVPQPAPCPQPIVFPPTPWYGPAITC